MSTKSITFGGNPVTLVGSSVKVGDKAPDFKAINDSLKEVRLSDYQGKVKLISVFPSIDTSVCSVQTRKFNKEAAAFGDSVVFISLSADLPFALKRFCGAEGIDNLISLSDHKALDFANKYGFLIEEFRLLARGVLVIDLDNTIRHVEIVSEIGHEPNYEAALAVLRQITG